MRKLIGSLKGISILLTSHNLSEIEELCDRIAVISNGEIRTMGTPENLRNSHKQTQKVKIKLRTDASEIFETLNNLKDFEFEQNGEIMTLKFTRDAEDESLGKTIAELSGKNAKILDVETEKATLLDVLESYE
jgi:ABC-2 type transport system ATP-binding protein